MCSAVCEDWFLFRMQLLHVRDWNFCLYLSCRRRLRADVPALLNSVYTSCEDSSERLLSGNIALRGQRTRRIHDRFWWTGVHVWWSLELSLSRVLLATVHRESCRHLICWDAKCIQVFLLVLSISSASSASAFVWVTDILNNPIDKLHRRNLHGEFSLW